MLGLYLGLCCIFEEIVCYIRWARSASTEHILCDWQLCFFVSHPLKWVNLFLSEWQHSWQLCMSHTFIYMGNWYITWTFFFYQRQDFRFQRIRESVSLRLCDWSPFKFLTIFNFCLHWFILNGLKVWWHLLSKISQVKESGTKYDEWYTIIGSKTNIQSYAS